MKSMKLVCGIDEAGRGPWAGPVTAAAVILDPDQPIEGLTDSKKLSEKKRISLEPRIKSEALAWGIGWSTVEDIDMYNIREATFLAMQRATAALNLQPDHALVDGNAIPGNLPCSAEAIIKGDLKEPCISAASILAKTARDRLMVDLENHYPGYGFAAHKGYGTAVHTKALQALGPCAAHRMSFAPVRKAAALEKRVKA